MNDAESIISIAQQADKVPEILTTKDGREFLVLPAGMNKIDVLDEHGLKRSTPAYLSQAVRLQTTDSLVEYVERFKGADTVLFADIERSTFMGVLDYHSAAKDGEPQVKRASHRATLVLPYSEEWKVWTTVDKTLMGQLDFARFIEENAPDIIAPPAGELLDAVRDLQAHRKVNFIAAVRTSSDNENFTFTEESEVRGKGEIELPTKFMLKLPVYFGEPATELGAFLRWRIDPEKGTLALGIALYRAEYVRQAVFKQIVLAVGDRTRCPVMFGQL